MTGQCREGMGRTAFEEMVEHLGIESDTDEFITAVNKNKI